MLGLTHKTFTINWEVAWRESSPSDPGHFEGALSNVLQSLFADDGTSRSDGLPTHAIMDSVHYGTHCQVSLSIFIPEEPAEKIKAQR